MIEKLISEALQKAVTAAVAASSTPGLEVKYMGRTLSPQPDKFLEVLQIINNMQNETWGKERVYQGTLRLILHWPVDDAGIYPSSHVLDSISAYFKKEDRLWNGSTAVHIYDHPNASSVIPSGKELLFPVSIPYRSFAR